MTGPNFDRIASGYRGTIYAVDRSTGAIKPITEAQYIVCQAAGLLGGYYVRLTEKTAEMTAARVRAEIAGRN